MIMIDIDQRMFYLMLSATEGQKFASAMGFPTPSEDVQELEIMDVLSRWMMVHSSGLLDEIREAADWFVSFLEETDKINSPSEDFVNALIVFAIGAGQTSTTTDNFPNAATTSYLDSPNTTSGVTYKTQFKNNGKQLNTSKQLLNMFETN